jgi:hypothetical protein
MTLTGDQQDCPNCGFDEPEAIDAEYSEHMEGDCL